MRLVFDRGTILCHPVRGGSPPAGLPGGVWDPRVAAVRVPAWRYPELLRHLHYNRVPVRNEVEPSPPCPVEDWDDPDLRPYQEAAVDAWAMSHRRGIVVLPTGSGKTRVALAAMARIRLPALCLVPTRVLLHQWRKEIVAVSKGRIGCLGDGMHELAPITVSTFESAYRHMARYGNRFAMLVVDEAHHFGNGLRDEALEMSIAPNRLGLTATPPSDPLSSDKLRYLIGPVIFQLSVNDLTGSYLASFDVITLRLELTPGERNEYESARTVFANIYREFHSLAPRGTWADFCRAARKTEAGRRGLAAWKRSRRLLAYTESKAAALGSLLERHRDSRILVFTAGNESTYAIAREHLIMPFTCDIGRCERDEVLERFRRGELKALVSARVLNEGLDVPDAVVAVIVGSAFGEREHIQRIGRLLRPGEGKRALVYELVTRNSIEVSQARRRSRSLDSSKHAPLQHSGKNDPAVLPPRE
jgi:superfamily II DNA or RNA helicase